ncbi:uncharacterized protein LOC122827103 [Gambusia affinis]|uniref:uncharacterized protein LOC122827103 n=1 Tax=Gambusia affinis TaxID=33528 RepID=UPI001CDD841E|nr:uncharacterized protein LOC122827103 [Gambusia affinis]
MFVFQPFFIGLLVLFTSQFGLADPIYRAFGGSVVLDPGHKPGSITSITWKHQEDLALDWTGEEIAYYRTFQGRCDLDKTTGRFTIKNLTLEDSGVYTPEINNVVGTTMELKVIRRVPKPRISMECKEEEKLCDLTCEASISSEFGLVTYKWKTGDTVLSDKKTLTITKKNESSFICVLTNLVSSSDSDEFSIPNSDGNNIAKVVAAVVLGVLLIGGIIVYVMYRKVPRVRAMWPFSYCSQNQDNAEEDPENAAPEEGQIMLSVPETPAANNSKEEGGLNGY